MVVMGSSCEQPGIASASVAGEEDIEVRDWELSLWEKELWVQAKQESEARAMAISDW